MSKRAGPRLLPAAATLAMTMLVVLAAYGGWFRAAEQRLDALSFLLFDRPSSGQVHVVEMDAASMASVGSWPWPRDHYARIVSQLDAAGVRSISFDLDFSGASEPDKDRAFAAALARSRVPVALPTFAQNAGFQEGRQLDSLPIELLRRHAQLASVSVIPDPDGFVRRMPLGTITGGTPRPSIAALVAGRSGTVGRSFPIDYAIRLDTIPRHSFSAVERGAFQADALKGKDVIIGATAIEMGDRYPVPRYGVIPGVMVQALAAETLRGGVPSYGGWVAPLALVGLFGLLVGNAKRRRVVLARAAIATMLLFALWAAARGLWGIWFEIVPALALVALATSVLTAMITHRAASRARRTDPDSGLPNKLALDLLLRADEHRYVIAAQIEDFDVIKQTVGEDNLGKLMRRLAERLGSTMPQTRICRIEDRMLAWATRQEICDLEDQMAALRAVMSSPFEIDGRRVAVALTFGVAPADGPLPAVYAAQAAAFAKRSGKQWRLHAEGESEALARQFSLLGEIDDAMSDGEIRVLYQPKLNIATGQIDAVEALVRWHHPERGLIQPDLFIPLIEESGRIDDLTLHVMALAIEDMRRWCDLGLVIQVAVNVSARALGSDAFAGEVLALLARTGAPAHRLTFELTESAKFEDTDRAIAMLAAFREAGINIALDDYGTGQSTLNYLKVLTVSELKIDRSFVQHAHVDRGDAMMVRSTIQLAHELGIKVVAEGVEDEVCLAFLEAIGCDYAQGYFVGRPMTADDLAVAVKQPATIAA